MSVMGVIGVLGIVGFGIGTIYPVATVSIQNAVARHQVGVAMGAMNFFRALASALVVAIMGAIVLAGLGVAPERGLGAGAINASVGALGGDVALVFRWVFASGAMFLTAGLIALLMMEERPLRTAVEPVVAATAAEPAE
jgi:hypothetical protein